MAVSWICLLLLASKGRSRVSFHFSGWSKYWVIQVEWGTGSRRRLQSGKCVSVWVCREEVKNLRVLRVRLCLFTGLSIRSQNQRPEYPHPTISQLPKCPHIDGFICRGDLLLARRTVSSSSLLSVSLSLSLPRSQFLLGINYMFSSISDGLHRVIPLHRTVLLVLVCVLYIVYGALWCVSDYCKRMGEGTARSSEIDSFVVVCKWLLLLQ